MDKIKPGDLVIYIGPDTNGVFIPNKTYKVASVQRDHDVIPWINIVKNEFGQGNHGYHYRYWNKVNKVNYLPEWF